jgi:ribosomal subunit interface protein
MNIVVSGKHIDVGESLRAHIEERMKSVVAKYSDRITNMHIVLSKQGAFFRVDITGHLGTHAGISLQARNEHSDAYTAFDEAAEKIGKQLRRYKRQITNHHNKMASDTAITTLASKYYVISAEPEAEEVPDNPIIIAEDASHIEHLTVSDAVMRLDLGELPALVFINQANERVNVIYRRHDGNIGWIDPELQEERSLAA